MHVFIVFQNLHLNTFSFLTKLHNCGITSSDSNVGGITYSSDRASCSYTTDSGVSVGGYVSSDSSYGGPSKGGEGYGAGLTLGFRF